MIAPATISFALPAATEQAVDEAAAAALEARIAERIWAGDDTVFGPAGQPEVADRLGWLQVGERTAALLPQLESLAASSRERGDRVVLVLGMGGSSLAPEVLSRAFSRGAQGPELRVLDSTVPAAVLEMVSGLDPATTLVIAASKSGGTIETRSQLELFWERFEHRADAFAAITDPGSDLAQLAHDRGFRALILADPEVGGRYSALTAFGLTPAAVAGYPVGELLASGAAAGETTTSNDAAANAALRLGLLMSVAAQAGRDKLTVVADPSLGGVELWLEQLVAESTGKHGLGILPVAGEHGGSGARFGDDRVVLRLRDAAAPVAALDSLAAALGEAGAPVATIEVGGPVGLGAIFFLTEFATAVAGWSLGINPFDQPNVQEAKDATKSVLAEGADAITLPSQPVREATDELLEGLAAPSYVAVLAYLAPSPSIDQAAARLQAAIRDATGAAVTFGYGPRYLHSTGQLHKGGPARGRFLLVVDDAAPDLEIPGAGHGFRTLAHAQAVGDLRTLHAHGLPAVLVTTGGAPAETLHELADHASRHRA
jgi:glucose-6-phosphate isomerase/transaldolase/glucose-6-phosphate isomerase